MAGKSTHLFDLTGRVAVITGGNGGIGLGMAQGLASAGAQVSIWGRSGAKNEAALATLAGEGHSALVCDVTDPAKVAEAFAQTVARHGRVDGCFANAGVGGGGRRAFVDRTDEEWRAMMATNLDGVFYVLREAARHMVARAKAGDAFGRLVATSSLASRFGTARNEHYAATKAAVNSIIQALAVELPRYGVTANSILPGWVRSDMTERLTGDDKFVANVMPRIPVRRFGEKEDFAGIAVYLMSGASAFHNGDTLLIDGGYSLY